MRHKPTGTVLIGYDGDGNRVKKTVITPTNSVTTFYVVDEQNPSGYAQVLEEHTSINAQSATIHRVYTYGLSLISQDRLANTAWVTSFYGYDGHNNVRYLTDLNGNVTDTYDYDAFGNLIAQSSVYDVPTPNSYLYCGEQFDADLGFYYNRARFLNTDVGRFWTMDLFEGITVDPLSLHKYLYANAEPVGSDDPSGYMTFGEVMEELKIQFNLRKSQVQTGNKVYKFTKRTVCNAGRLTFTAGAVAYGGHHIWPKFMGGAQKQVLAEIGPDLHLILHRLIQVLVKDDALLGELSALGGENGATKDWLEAFKDPDKFKRAMDILKKATQAVDKFCGFKKPTMTDELELMLNAP